MARVVQSAIMKVVYRILFTELHPSAAQESASREFECQVRIYNYL